MVNLHILGGIEDPREQIIVAKCGEQYAHITRTKNSEKKISINLGDKLNNVPQFSISANFEKSKALTDSDAKEFMGGITSITIPKDSKIKREKAFWLLSTGKKQKQARAA